MLYSAIKKHLPSRHDELDIDFEDDSADDSENSLSRIIPKEIAQMSVALTEYFQMQRKIYEDVSFNSLAINHHMTNSVQ